MATGFLFRIMLPTLPPAVNRHPPTVSRRGAQPANTNAFKHGLYSARLPHPTALALRDLRFSKRLLTRDSPRPSGDLDPAYQRGGQGVAAKPPDSPLPVGEGSGVRETTATRLLASSARLLDRTYADLHSLGGDEGPIGDKAWLFHQGLFLQAVSLDISIKGRLFKLHQEANLLKTIAARASVLYNWEFERKGLLPYPLPPYPQPRRSGPDSQASAAEYRISTIESPQPPFVPQSLRKKSAISSTLGSPLPSGEGPVVRETAHEGLGVRVTAANLEDPAVLGSPSFVAFLTDSQWTLLQPLMATLRAHQARQRTYRLKPRWDDRRLLDSILWKLASACRWEDLMSLRAPLPRGVAISSDSLLLPTSGFLRAAKVLYRQLCLSGRMATIYTLLHCHLEQSAPSPSGEGWGGVTTPHFQILNGRVALTSAAHSAIERPTWHHRTALLLLQRALFNYRAQKRERDLERRLRGRSLRLPALRFKSMRPHHHHRQPTSLLPPASVFATEPALRSPRRGSGCEGSSFPLSSFPSLPNSLPDYSCSSWISIPSPSIPQPSSNHQPSIEDGDAGATVNVRPLESTLAYRKWLRLNHTELLLRANLSPPRRNDRHARSGT